MLVAELFYLLGDLPVEVVTLAFCALTFDLVHLAKNLGANWTIRREHFFDSACREVHTSFSHSWMDHFASTHECGTAGRVIAHTSATNTFFILFVPLLTCIFVFF